MGIKGYNLFFGFVAGAAIGGAGGIIEHHLTIREIEQQRENAITFLEPRSERQEYNDLRLKLTIDSPLSDLTRYQELSKTSPVTDLIELRKSYDNKLWEEESKAIDKMLTCAGIGAVSGTAGMAGLGYLSGVLHQRASRRRRILT